MEISSDYYLFDLSIWNPQPDDDFLIITRRCLVAAALFRLICH
jgi:hypothetical protein